MEKNKNIVRFNEEQLNKMVRESIEKVLNEIGDTNRGQYMLGRLAGRQSVYGDNEESDKTTYFARLRNNNRHMGNDWFDVGKEDYSSYVVPGVESITEPVEKAVASEKLPYIPKTAEDAFDEEYGMGFGPKGLYDKRGRQRRNWRLKESVDNEVTRISFDDIKEAVSKSVKAILESRKSLNEDFYYGDGEVDESTFDSMDMTEKKSELQKRNKKKKKEKEHDRERNREKNKRDPHTSRKNQKRRIVINYLKQDGVDVAPFAYELWPDKDEDSGRSLFYKCLDNKEYNGSTYKFNDSDINKLYSMISSQSV